MKFVAFHFLVVAALALPSLAQTTNFTPKAPPRSYNTVVRLDYVEMHEAESRDREDETLFVPNMGQRLEAQNVRGGESSGAASRQTGSRVMRRPAESGDSNKKPTLSEIAAGDGRANSPAIREGSVVSEIMKQRAVSQKATAKIREDEGAAKFDDAAAANVDGRGMEAQAGSKRDSMWHSTDEMAAVLANQRKVEGAAPATAGDSADPFSRNARDGAIGGNVAGGAGILPAGRGADFSSAPAAPSLSRSQDADRGASLFGSGSPAFFGAAQMAPQYGSLSPPAGGGLYSRDESIYRAPSAPASAYGIGFGAGDSKKPTTLPW